MIISGATIRSLPIASHTITEDEALSNPMVVQTMGKTRGGGIQDGRFLSFLAFSSTEILGREASRVLNTRDLMEITKKKRVTNPLLRVSGGIALERREAHVEKVL